MALPRMKTNAVLRRMKTFSFVPLGKTVSGEIAAFRREIGKTEKLAEGRTAVERTEGKIRGAGDRFLFTLSGVEVRKREADF